METGGLSSSARQQTENDDSFDFDDLEGCFDSYPAGVLLGPGERREVDDISPDDITAAGEVLGCSPPQQRATMLPWMELDQEHSQKSANELMDEVRLSVSNVATIVLIHPPAQGLYLVCVTRFWGS
jgi:hypothetical protein